MNAQPELFSSDWSGTGRGVTWCIARGGIRGRNSPIVVAARVECLLSAHEHCRCLCVVPKQVNLMACCSTRRAATGCESRVISNDCVSWWRKGSYIMHVENQCVGWLHVLEIGSYCDFLVQAASPDPCYTSSCRPKSWKEPHEA